ncbi:lipopolysaccharide transport periplasmic protein LptA [Massilia norwichensis]|jgi:lipopolysaccharide export system protein LptA|uniref:Lipopolysaccharide export system protein LptA n=1 Tax=Massilia norwichensis TaxID=1442366 RepID=A0ABT2A1Q3_9BURK|nr:lipopolysaccharide transport periplasmic protein LptA [Massilia norwichensis]MCS0588119.1 lipopolysaccharide transport periplasmic protein LptA [Massilia norwichensis]
MKKIFAVAALALATLTASAERADSLKQAQVDFNNGHLDEVTQTRTLTGNVVLTRGTLLIKSDKAVMKETPEGYMLLTLTAEPGKVASFRQKRDGGPDLWTEGQAQRIEYDERTEVVKLFSNAVVKQLEGKRMTSEVTGPFISYDNRTEQANVHNDASGESKQGGGRSTIIIAPRRTAPAASATTPAGAGKQ